MKKTFLLFTLSLTAMLWQSAISFAQPQTQQFSKVDNLYFLENKGQITDQYGNQRNDLDFRIAANGVNVFIGDGQLHYQWNKVASKIASKPSSLDELEVLAQPIPVTSYRMDVTLVGANRNATVVTSAAHDYTEYYYLPQFGTSGIRTNSYEKITYKEVYPGIDWVIYVKNKRIEYDFVVRPGARVADIKLKYDGATDAFLNESGGFTTTNPMGSVTEQAPVSYLENGGAVASHFVWQDNVLGFETAPYQGTLIIDPTLIWGTYYGYDGQLDQALRSVTDRNSNLYLAGITTSTMNIATTGAFQATYNGVAKAYLAKFNAIGTLQWGTYFGGNSYDYPVGLTVDTLGHVYLGGSTGSTAGITTPGSYQPVLAGGIGAYKESFLAQFDTLGARIWATYFGGPRVDQLPSLASDGAHVYMCGTTNSTTGIATAGSYQPALGGATDCYLAKFNSAGNVLWSTYFGGTGGEHLYATVACDKSGNIYIAGTTSSANAIATPGAYKETLSPITSTGTNDGYLAKFNSAGVLQWGTYFGGPGNDYVDNSNNVSCDAAGNIYIGGHTTSTTDIASAGTHQTAMVDARDAFVAKFNAAGAYQWSSYFGGPDTDYGFSVVGGDTDEVYLLGATESTTGISSANNNHQSTFSGGTSLWGDAFIAQFNATGQIKWSTYFGGTANEYGTGSYDPKGYLYINGCTMSSTGIATSGSYMDTLPAGGGGISYVSKFCIGPRAGIESIIGNDSVCAYSVQTYSTASAEDRITAYVWELPVGWVGSSTTDSITVTVGGAANATLKVRMVRCGDTTTAQSIAVYVKEPPPAIITVNGFVLGTINTHKTYQWLKGNQIIQGATNATYSVTENANYSVATTDESGCVDTSDVFIVTNVSVPTIVQLQSAIVVYPNPATDKITIQSPIPVNVKVAGIDGKLVMQQDKVSVMELSSLAPGVYILSITDEWGLVLKTEKLTKLK